MLKRMTMLVIFWMVLGGCSRTYVYVLEEKEIERVKVGQVVTATYDGWLYSDRAVDRVMDVKVKKEKMR